MSETTSNPWADDEPAEATKPAKAAKAAKPARPEPAAAAPGKNLEQQLASQVEYDLEGLMTDFPTARDLERFVFDETGIVLNLRGRSNKLKYQVAMDVLNGSEVDPAYLGRDNPYLEKTDLVPEEPMKVLPPRSSELPPRSEVQNEFFTAFVPHSDPEYHAQGRKMHCTFRKYQTGVITYEVLGPIEPRPHGEKIDKWGKVRPEIIKWVDPRTGEQIVQREDGTLTPIGRRLRAMMQTFRYNNTNQWIRYVDRDFLSLDMKAAINPWDLENE